MPYADRGELVQRFGDIEVSALEDPVGSGIPDSAISEEALIDASDEIDSYILVRYSLPLPSVPQQLKRVCCDIARYRLYKDRPTEEITTRYNRSIKWLEQLAVGKVLLTFDPVLTPEQIDESVKQPVPYAPIKSGNGVFTDETLDKMPGINL